MAKQSKFTIRPIDREQINRLNNAIRAKQQREGLNFPTRSTNQFVSRADYNRYIKEGTNFLQNKNIKTYTNKYGVTFNEYEKRDIERSVKNINRHRAKLRERYEDQDVIGGGGQKVWDRKLGGDPKLAELNDRNLNLDSYRSHKEFRTSRQGTRKTELLSVNDKKAERFKKNMIKAIRDQYGRLGSDMIADIQAMSNDDFLDFYYTHPDFSIGFHYEKIPKSDRMKFFREILGGAR